MRPLSRLYFYLFTILSSAGYYAFGYLIEREQSLILTGLFGLLFCVIYFVNHRLSTNQIFWSGLIFRFLFIFSIPILSQDFYRFIWDGLLLNNGWSPYAFSPNEFMTNNLVVENPIFEILHSKMGELSAQHYSNYPPLNQLGFSLATYWFPNSIFGSILLMRLLIILADLGVFFVGKSLLNHLGLPIERIGWYFLNPLIIIELTGNLHWEGVMLIFFLLGVWLLINNRVIGAAITFGLSVLTKLIPLLFLAVFIRHQTIKRNLLMGVSGVTFCVLFSLPFFFSVGLENYLNTLQLWFKNFEFNGSIYYIIRWIGYQVKGYNIIRQLGEITPFIILFAVFAFSFFRSKKKLDQVFESMLLLLAFYYFIASIVHPWYVITLVSLSLFTRYRFALVWSALVPVSYVTYGNPNFSENYLLIGLEYSLVYGVLLYELVRKETLFKHLQ